MERPTTDWVGGVLLVAVLLLGPMAGAAHAQDGAAGAFARSGFDARGEAMGNALGADATGDVSPYYNPALAPYVSDQHISASAAFLSMDREQQTLQFAVPLEPTAGVAAYVIRAAVEDIDGRDRSGFHTGTLSTEELAGALAFGNRFSDRLTLGAALKFYRADFFEGVDPELSLGVDLGAVVHASEALTVSLTVNDLLASYSWDGTGGRAVTDDFPVRLRGGLSYTLLDDRLQLVAEYESRIATREEITLDDDGARQPVREVRTHHAQGRLGGAFALADMFSVRAGIDRIGVAGSEGLRPSAGFGIDQPVGNLDVHVAYAFALDPHVRTGAHLLTLQIFI